MLSARSTVSNIPGFASKGVSVSRKPKEAVKSEEKKDVVTDDKTVKMDTTASEH